MNQTSETIYLDHAAATPIDPGVMAAMRPYLEEHFANPSGMYPEAKAARHAIDQARADVAAALGAKRSEIIFTAGATESNNLALTGLARSYPGRHIVTTAIEHHAVLSTAEALRAGGTPVSVVPVPPSGIVAARDVAAAIRDDTVVVSVMYANNEVGTIQPLGAIAKAIAAARRRRAAAGNDIPIYLHTDACQAAPYLDLHVSRLGVDLMTLNSSKMYGPKQIACLYVRSGVRLEPILHGGGQERGLRSGTENVAGIVGLAAALTLVQNRRAGESARLRQLRDLLVDTVLREVPGSVLNGSRDHRLPNNVNLSFEGVLGEDLVLYLARRGIAASTGSACSANQEDPSHVLLAIGLSRAMAEGSLRLTLGHGTTRAQIDHVLRELPGIITTLRSHA